MTRLLVIDLAGYIENNITEIVSLTPLPQPGYPASASFVPASRASICRSPTNGAPQAVSVYLESFTTPLEVSLTVYTASGIFQTFATS